LNARIPATSVLSRRIPVAWHRRGAAMRSVRQHADEAQMDTLDGIRIVEPDRSWCLVLPEDDQASFMLFAEASQAKAAAELLDHWQGIVEGAT
jgi:phosphomannomutase